MESLRDRRGFRQLLDTIDEEVIAEMTATLGERAARAVETVAEAGAESAGKPPEMGKVREPRPHPVQMATDKECLVVLLSDGTLWSKLGSSWVPIALPPPCAEERQP